MACLEWVNEGEYRRIFAFTGEPEVPLRFTVGDWRAVAFAMGPKRPQTAREVLTAICEAGGLALAADVRVEVWGCRGFAAAVGEASAAAGVAEWDQMTGEAAVAAAEAWIRLGANPA